MTIVLKMNQRLNPAASAKTPDVCDDCDVAGAGAAGEDDAGADDEQDDDGAGMRKAVDRCYCYYCLRKIPTMMRLAPGVSQFSAAAKRPPS